eukprot:1593871-Prymnesium_polylepis.1
MPHTRAYARGHRAWAWAWTRARGARARLARGSLLEQALDGRLGGGLHLGADVAEAAVLEHETPRVALVVELPRWGGGGGSN